MRKHRMSILALAAVLVLLPMRADQSFAQGRGRGGGAGNAPPPRPTPRWPDGTVNWGAPVGEPGLWNVAGGVFAIPDPAPGVTVDPNDALAGKPTLSQVPFQPWARAIYDYRQENQLEPYTRCKPSGAFRQVATAYGTQFVHFPEEKQFIIFQTGGSHRLSVAALVLCVTRCAEAQQPKVYRVGVLSPPGSQERSPDLKGLRVGLREAGYIEGKNLQLNIPSVKTYDELRPIAKEYVEKRVHAIVTNSGAATSIASDATKEIPIIFIWGVGDPVGSGLVKSMARPERNITGLTSEAGDQMYAKRLELFREVVPSLRRVPCSTMLGAKIQLMK